MLLKDIPLQNKKEEEQEEEESITFKHSTITRYAM